MISKSISISEKVNLLPDIFDMLLFTWLITHSDDFGRLTGSPAKVKALVVPMLDKSIMEIEQSLTTLHNKELIVWYETEGNKYIQIINFEKHQTGLHKRTQSKLPEPPEYSRKFPEVPPQGKGTELNLTEGNRTEEKGTEGSPSAPLSDIESLKDHLLKLVNQANIKTPYNLNDLDTLYSYIGVVDIEVIEAAIKKAFNKDHFNYIINTLNGMIKDGKTKKEHLFAKPEPGQAPSNVTQFPRTGYSKKESLPIAAVPDDLPEMTDEQLAEARKLAQTLDAAR